MPWGSSSSSPSWSSVPPACSLAPNASDEARGGNSARRRGADAAVLDHERLLPPRRHHGGSLRRPRPEPQSLARVHGAAFPRTPPVLRHRRVPAFPALPSVGMVVFAGPPPPPPSPLLSPL